MEHAVFPCLRNLVQHSAPTGRALPVDAAECRSVKYAAYVQETSRRAASTLAAKKLVDDGLIAIGIQPKDDPAIACWVPSRGRCAVEISIRVKDQPSHWPSAVR